MKEGLFPVMGIFCLSVSKNHSVLELMLAVVEPQY
jgi:hypothetical protein